MSLSTCDNCQDKHCVVNCTTVNCDRATSTISTVVPSMENDGTCRETCQVSNQSCQVYLYRGYPLNINAIVKKTGPGVLHLYKDKSKTRSANQEKSKTRSFVKCLVCAEYEEEAKRFSTNHQVYLAYGVRCDGKKKMQDVVDHLLGAAHDAAVKLKTLSNQWATKAPYHPWLRTLQNHDPSIVRTLTHMAVDVYNDSKLLTSAVWSWPSRSLSQLHAEEQFIKYTNDSPEGGIKFSEFQSQAIQLHYRDPGHYAEMLHIQGDLERQKLNEELRTCLRFAVQVDGSVDTKQQDKKFVLVRFNSEENPLSIQTRFVSVKQVEKHGAGGLLDAVVSSLMDVGLDDMVIKSKYSGLTTDGESANTGQKSGLWARMDEYVGHPSFNL